MQQGGCGDEILWLRDEAQRGHGSVFLPRDNGRCSALSFLNYQSLKLQVILWQQRPHMGLCARECACELQERWCGGGGVNLPYDLLYSGLQGVQISGSRTRDKTDRLDVRKHPEVFVGQPLRYGGQEFFCTAFVFRVSPHYDDGRVSSHCLDRLEPLIGKTRVSTCV